MKHSAASLLCFIYLFIADPMQVIRASGEVRNLGVMDIDKPYRNSGFGGARGLEDSTDVVHMCW